MANYYGSGRSNYVMVTDLDKAKKIASMYGCNLIEGKIEDRKDRVAFLAQNDSGDVETSIVPDEDELKIFFEIFGEDEDEPINTGDEVDLPDFMETVADILVSGEVFIWMSVGNENLRYISGYARAINSDREQVNMNLDMIYDLSKTLGSVILPAQS